MVCEEGLREGFACPSYPQVKRWVRKELPPSIADYHRHGPRWWNAKHAPFIERNAVEEYRPNQCWCGDHHQFDFWGAHLGKAVRFWATGWLDMASRSLFGVVSPSPNSGTLLRAFRSGVLKHGAPAEIIVDNGKDYRAKGVTGGRRKALDEEQLGMMGALGIAVHFAQAYHPQSKPIERTFRTICERFSKLFESYCGNRPDARPESLNADLRAGKLKLPTLQEVRELFAVFIEAYHDTPHEGAGMNGRSPNEVFATNPIARRTAPESVLNLMLTRRERAKVSRNGVRYMGAQYGQHEIALLNWQGKEVEIRVDEDDASCVLVFEPGGKFICRAENARRRGTDQKDVRAGMRAKAAAKRTAESARPKAIEALMDVTAHAHVNAQKKRAERLAQMRQAAGGETVPVMRDVELLPGAAEAQDAVEKLAKRGRRGSPAAVTGRSWAPGWRGR